MDFQFLQNPISGKWVILAPKRAKRPDVSKGSEPICPFCVGREGEERELYRVRETTQDSTQNNAEISVVQRGVPYGSAQNSDWSVRVLGNKFPFAPVHEVIVHSQDHHKNFGELSKEQVNLIFQTYKQRYLAHQEKGQVFIFHNRGESGGESLPHPHTQLAVVPFEVKIETPILLSVIPNSFRDPNQQSDEMLKQVQHDILETNYFYLFCPKTSQWPDEVWVAPKKRGRSFGEITEEEISDLSDIISRLVQILDLRHGNEFPYNFYIYPDGDWYLRLIPRVKKLGGFEIGTGIFVNTQDPQETIAFIKEHFDLSAEEPNIEKIKSEHQAEYGRTV